MSAAARRFAAAFAFVATCLLWLHTLHMLAGHEWFASYGLVPAALLAVFLTCFAPARAGARWSAALAPLLMLMLFVVVEWLEGELAARHRLSWPLLADHGWPVLLSVGLLLGGLMVAESARVVRLLGDARDGR